MTQDFKFLEIPKKNEIKGYIYYLLDEEDKILYVGQTQNLFLRIGTHLSKKEIPFSHAKYLTCDPADLITIEVEEILTHWPPYNKSVPPNPLWLSHEGYKKINPSIKGRAVKVNKLLRNLQIHASHGYVHINDWTRIADEIEGEKK